MASGDIIVDLDLIGGVTGTDKSSADNNYLVHYDRLFSEFRDQDFNFIEIGVFRGASLAMWRQYFSSAAVIGVDIQDHCRQYARDDITVEIGSQEDPGFLADLVRKYPPRIIIDDGSHMAHHVIFTFEALFPSLEAGGIYVIEDLHFHAGAMREHTRGPSAVNPIDYFLSLSRMVVANEVDADRDWGFLKYAFRTIDEIMFFSRAAAIRKKAPNADQTGRIDLVMQMARAAGTADAWERASKYLAGNHAVPAAMQAIKSAITIDPSAGLYRRLSLFQAIQGDQGAALETAGLSVHQPGDAAEIGECWEQFGNLLADAGRVDEAMAAFAASLKLVAHPVVQERLRQKIRKHDPAD